MRNHTRARGGVMRLPAPLVHAWSCCHVQHPHSPSFCMCRKTAHIKQPSFSANPHRLSCSPATYGVVGAKAFYRTWTLYGTWHCSTSEATVCHAARNLRGVFTSSRMQFNHLTICVRGSFHLYCLSISSRRQWNFVLLKLCLIRYLSLVYQYVSMFLAHVTDIPVRSTLSSEDHNKSAFAIICVIFSLSNNWK